MIGEQQKMEDNIVIAYLEQQYQNVYQCKLNIEQECQKQQIRLQNIVKFIATLQNSLDDNFESFFPRKQERESHDKIGNLEKEKEEIELKLEKLFAELQKIQSDLDKLDIVLNAERKNIKECHDTKECLNDGKSHYRNILETLDKERQRSAKYLYDEMIQLYDKMLHKIEVCSRLVNIDTMRSHKELNDMADTMNQSMQGMIKILYDIPPMSLKNMELYNIVKQELSVLEISGLKVFFEMEGKSRNLSFVVKLTIIKVLREAIDNILKYANAENVIVKIKFKETNVELLIEDDGLGFDTNSLKYSENVGVGISIMKERVFLLEGKFKIISLNGKGTKIYMAIPFEK